MKIGILLTCYNCEAYVDDCLSPWLNLREELNLVFAANSGMFRDYLALGITEKNEGTLKKLLEKKLDFLVTTSGKNLLDEEASRNTCLEFLKKQQCDLILLLDGDEVYTEEQIRSIFHFVHQHPSYDGYSVNFKNYVFRKGLFLYDFCHDRIFWLNRGGGIERFHFDNQFFYVDRNYSQSNRIAIPKSLAYVDHFSWLSEDPRTADKIKYQNQRYTGPEGNTPLQYRCSFRTDPETGRLEFNPEFWTGPNVQIPVLHEMGHPYSFDFKLDFSREYNRIMMENVSKETTYNVEVYDGNTLSLIYGCDLNVSPSSSFWINPDYRKHFDTEPGFVSFLVIVRENDQVVHTERLHLKRESS